MDYFIVLLLTLFVNYAAVESDGHGQRAERSFVIDYENDRFLKDGEAFRYISGSMHYFRIHPTDWSDRLKKMRMAGFNTLQTYVEWSSHEPEPEQYQFSGGVDLQKFITTAQEQDLLVILRLGPYMDAERDFGGFPYWLLSMNPDMRLRSSDPSYLHYVDKWLTSGLLPKIKPLLYKNGGPIIMVQIENEYGSYPACDYAYTAHLRDLVRNILGDDVVLFTTDGDGVGYLKCGKIQDVYSTVDFGSDLVRNILGDDVVLFTTDGDGVGYLKCGKIQDVYSTVDFGSGTNVTAAFGAQRLFEPRGPLINSEYYPGWLDHWGVPHANVDAQAIAKTLDQMLEMNASVSMYMFHGGTSFGLTSGSNQGGKFQACPTSYDYDAPLSEAGDPTEKYWIIRNVTKKYLPLPSGDVPPPSAKFSYGKVGLKSLGDVMTLSKSLTAVNSKWPLTFEQLRVSNGLVVYKTVIPFRIADPTRLTISDVHDRGYVYLNGIYAGTVDREQELYDLPISAPPNASLTIIVESQGRICFGPQINDFKGLTTNVTVNDHQLENWSMIPLPLANFTRLASALKRFPASGASSEGRMSFYRGQFTVPGDSSHPRDTFLRLDGWSKGLAWVNGFALGRYWPEVGPQVTLYVPHGALSNGSNNITLLELENAPCLIPDTCYVTLTDTHVIDGPTPY